MTAPLRPSGDEFYVGYLATMPPRMATRLRRVCGALAVMAVLGAGVVLAVHRRLERSDFEFGRPRQVSGRLERLPYPSLDVSGARIWLVAPGKHGADAIVAGVPDGPVTLHGARISRGRHTMLEVVPGTVTATSQVAPPPAPTAETGRDVTLRGEIVDSKCFLGVMNPGESVVHRDCARLCLRGGIPPMLLVRGAGGEEALVLLVSESGAAIGEALAEVAGVPVEIRGRLVRERGALVLRVSRSQVRVLG